MIRLAGTAGKVVKQTIIQAHISLITAVVFNALLKKQYTIYFHQSAASSYIQLQLGSFPVTSGNLPSDRAISISP